MGMVLSLSEPSVDMLLYGDKSNFLAGYLSNQMQQIGPAFNEFSQRVYNSIQNSYNFVTDKLTQYGIKNELSAAGVAVSNNYYQELTSYEQLQNANGTMQRWVMCHPELRQMYIDQNVDGYSESYKNVFGKEVGEEDYNYRLVMDGVIRDDGDVSFYRHYYEDLLPGDRKLDHYEKDMILNTHSAIDWVLKNSDFDFTCKSDSPVKRNV